MPLTISELQKLHIDDPLIEIIGIDATNIGGELYYVTNDAPPPGVPELRFKGRSVLSIPIQTEGWEEATNSLLPTPKVTVSNINKDFFNAIQTTGDLTGAYVYRWLIFSKNLDTGTHPDSNKATDPQKFVIQRKAHHSDTHITWQLFLPFEMPNVKLPRERVLRSRGFLGAGKGGR